MFDRPRTGRDGHRRQGIAVRAADALGIGIVHAARTAAMLLLLGPIGLVIFLSFGADAYTTIPPSGYSLKWYENVFAEPEFVSSFWVSIQVAAIVTPVSLVIGTLGGFALHRYRIRGGDAIQALFYSPIMIPQVVTGIALLIFLNKVAFYSSFWGIVLGHIIITFPYVIRTVLVALSRYDLALDDASASMGARPHETFMLITLPIIRPGLFAGGLFAFVMSFDDFTVTIFLIGPDTTTLPVAIYQYMEWNLDATVSAVSALLVLMAVVSMLALERSIGLARFVGLRG